MINLPLAPKEVAIEVAAQGGHTVTFVMRPAPKSAVQRHMQGSAASLSGSLVDEDGNPLLPEGLSLVRELEMEETEVRQLFVSCFLRAVDDDGDEVQIAGEPLDPRKREHYDALPQLWVIHVISELLTAAMSLPKALEGNSKAPAGPSDEDSTPSPSPDSTGASAPSS